MLQEPADLSGSPDMREERPPAGAFGRVAVAGEQRHCRFTGDGVELLDRPAWEPGAVVAGEAGAAMT